MPILQIGRVLGQVAQARDSKPSPPVPGRPGAVCVLSARRHLPFVRVLHLFLSEGHNFVGRNGRTPEAYPISEVARAECVAGQGLRGDRFFNHRSDFKGQITFFSIEVLREVAQELGLKPIPLEAARRNVLVQEADLNELIGQEFSVQGVRFFGTEECRPCYWMETAIGRGAEAQLRGRGGLRAKILSDGWLTAEQS